MYQSLKGGKSGVSDLLAILTQLIPIKTLIHYLIIYQSSNNSKLINGDLSYKKKGKDVSPLPYVETVR
mgnify:CR=1 FL=1